MLLRKQLLKIKTSNSIFVDMVENESVKLSECQNGKIGANCY